MAIIISMSPFYMREDRMKRVSVNVPDCMYTKLHDLASQNKMPIPGAPRMDFCVLAHCRFGGCPAQGRSRKRLCDLRNRVASDAAKWDDSATGHRRPPQLAILLATTDRVALIVLLLAPRHAQLNFGAFSPETSKGSRRFLPTFVKKAEWWNQPSPANVPPHESKTPGPWPRGLPIRLIVRDQYRATTGPPQLN